MANDETELTFILNLMVMSKKLDREKGESMLNDYRFSDSNIQYLSNWILKKIESLSVWEDVYGGLTAFNILIKNVDFNSLEKLGVIEQVQSIVVKQLENSEFRVRIVAGEVMGSLCGCMGLLFFLKYLPIVIQGVGTNMKRDNELSNSDMEVSMKQLELEKECEAKNLNKSTLSIFHDTAGWKNLETWMKCLQEMVSNLPCEDFVQVDRIEILDLIFMALDHPNRFVRETGYDVLGTMISRHVCYKNPNNSDMHKTTYCLVAQKLAKGLSDNWSQVRMAASKATRTFFGVDPPPNHLITDVYCILLPPMCLNRFYIAEGVRIYSLDTWCQVTKGQGKQLLSFYLDQTLDFYITQIDAENHAVREAACAAISEVVTKLDPELLKCSIKKLLDALISCFDDESWPVRDAACCSLGSFIFLFPQEIKQLGFDDLFASYFLTNLCDSIPSVRSGAARSIGLILKSANDLELVKLYHNFIKEKMTAISTQVSESHGTESHRLNGHGPGASRAILHTGSMAHDARYTDQVMYSCCSLAPKLKKHRKGGCHDGLTQRKSEPWEEADGALRLIGQICECCPNFFEDSIVQYMNDATSYKHYKHYPYFLETASDVISTICQNMEKQKFKTFLDNFLVILSGSMQSGLPLAVDAAKHAIRLISQKIGPNILQGRIRNHFDFNVSKNLILDVN